MMDRLMAILTCPRINNRVPPPGGGPDAGPTPVPGKNNKDTHYG